MPLPSRAVGVAALGLGFAVLAFTAASQTGLLGGHDFVLIAVAGLIAAVFCLIVAFEAPSRLALLGAVMSALPVVLVAYFLLTTDG